MPHILRNYIIPIIERTSNLCGGSAKTHTKLMEVDLVGLIVSYNTEDQLTVENIRRHLICAEKKYIVIRAENIAEAMKQFNDMEAAKTGGKHKAMELDDSKLKPIQELPPCKHIHDDGDFFKCGYFDSDGDNFPRALCFLGGGDYDDCDYCPLENATRTVGESIVLGGVNILSYVENK